MNGSAKPDASNVEVIRTLLGRVGLLGSSRAQAAAPTRARSVADLLRVEQIAPAPNRGTAVDVSLATPAGALVVRIDNAAPERPAFAKTTTYSLSYIGELSAPERQIPLLRAFTSLIGRADAGVRLVEPPPEPITPAPEAPKSDEPTATADAGRRRSLPMATSDDPLREREWSRARFEEAVAKVAPLPPGNGGITVVVNNSCQQNCIFCPELDRVTTVLHREDPHYNEKHLADLIRQLEAGRAVGADVVEFGGADVLRFEHALELFHAAGRLGYQGIMAQSPSHVLADRAFAKAVSESPLTEIWAPLYGSTAEVHDSITQTPGGFDQLCRAIENLREFDGPAIRLHTIVLKRTMHRLAELIDFCNERFHLPLFVNALRPNRVGEEEHFSDLVSFADAKAHVRGRSIHLMEFPLCQFPEEDAALEMYRARRAIPGSLARPFSFFNLGLGRLSEEETTRRSRTVSHPSACDGCLLQAGCPGVITAYTDRMGTDELRPFRDEAKLATALERVGEPFADVALPLEHRVALVRGGIARGRPRARHGSALHDEGAGRAADPE